MLNHSLIFLALISFSMVSNAAAIPMDADQAAIDANQNAVLHMEVEVIQGGGADKDVAEVTVDHAVDSESAKPNVRAVSNWFAAQDDDGSLQPLVVMLLIVGLIVYFLSRKSSSTK